MSERSQASCSVTKLRLAATRNPSASKPAGMPQDCDPASAEPICTPLPWPLTCRLSNAMAAALPGPGRGIVADLVRAVLPRRQRRIRRARRRLATRSRPPAWPPRRERMNAADGHHGHHHQQARSAGTGRTPRPGPANAPARPGRGRRPGRPAWRPTGAWARPPPDWRRAAGCAAGLAWFCAGAGAEPARRRLALRHVARLPADRAAAAQRRAASASKLASASTATNIQDQIFIRLLMARNAPQHLIPTCRATTPPVRL